MTPSRKSVAVVLASAILALLSACADAEKPVEHGILPIKFVRLEPKALSRCTRVEWTIESAEGTFSGVATVDSATSISFDVPTVSQITSLALRGFDAQNRLRAEGSVDQAALLAATPANPARLFFPLYDEFVALEDTRSAPLTGHVGYLSANKRTPIFLGGFDTSPRRAVEALNLDTLSVESVGQLAYGRSDPGSRWADGRLLLVGGSGDSNADLTAEYWDPVTLTSQTLQQAFPGAATFATTRPFRPSLTRVAGETWFVGGHFSGSHPADRLSAAGLAPSLPSFESRSGDVTLFARNVTSGAGSPYDELYRIGGVDGGAPLQGAIYRSNASSSTGTFSTPLPVYRPQVFARPGGQLPPTTWLWGGELGAGLGCGLAIQFTSGILGSPASIVYTTLDEPSCGAGVFPLDSTRLLVAGGANNSEQYTRAVGIFDFDSGSFSPEMTLDGMPQQLVYDRVGAVMLVTTDGVAVVIGGRGPTSAELPRIELRIPSPM